MSLFVDRSKDVLSENADASYDINALLEIPEYLSYATNSTFEQMVRQKIYHLSSSVNMEELRDITILMHQLCVLDSEKSLWIRYLQSGTGTLVPSESALHVWPTHVKRMFRLEQSSTSTADLNPTAVNDNHYLKFVKNYQHELNTKQEQLRQQLTEKKQQFHDFTKVTDDTLRAFIQKHLQSRHAQYEYRIKLVHFNYREQILDHAFQQENPHLQQIEYTKRLFHRNHDHEQAKQEVQHMKHCFQHNQLPKVLRSLDLPLPSSVQSLADEDLRQKLSDCFNQIVQQYKNEMMALLSDAINAKLSLAQKLFNNEIAMMWQQQRTLPANQKLTPNMISVIDRHLLLIAEKVQCTFQYQQAATIPN